MSTDPKNAIVKDAAKGSGGGSLLDPNDDHHSRADARMVRQAIAAGWIDPDEWRETLEKGVRIANETDDAREYSAALSPMLATMKMTQAERLHDKAKKVEVDHNHKGGVLLMPASYIPDQPLPEADLDTIDVYEVAKNGGDDE